MMAKHEAEASDIPKAFSDFSARFQIFGDSVSREMSKIAMVSSFYIMSFVHCSGSGYSSSRHGALRRCQGPRLPGPTPRDKEIVSFVCSGCQVEVEVCLKSGALFPSASGGFPFLVRTFPCSLVIKSEVKLKSKPTGHKCEIEVISQ